MPSRSSYRSAAAASSTAYARARSFGSLKADIYQWVFNILSHSKSPWMFRACEHEPDRAEKDADGELMMRLAVQIDTMPYSADWWTLQHHVYFLLTRHACPEWRTSRGAAAVALPAASTCRSSFARLRLRMTLAAQSA